MSRNSIPSSPDQDQRDLILRELDKSMLVEAAAGTGKTRSMVTRMVELLRTGKCENIRFLAAVTFTRKAAAELRARFQVKLEQALRESDGGERGNLQHALDNIDQCFIGTIHSFCGRMLRERPVEAGVDVAFEEIDEDADYRLRVEAWSEYCARLLAVDDDGIIDELDRLGLRLSDLEATFLRFTDYPDVDEWPGPKRTLNTPAVERTIEQVRDYLAHMRNLAPKLPKEWGTDDLIPTYLRLPRIVSHYDDLSHPSHLMDVLSLFDKAGKI